MLNLDELAKKAGVQPLASTTGAQYLPPTAASSTATTTSALPAGLSLDQLAARAGVSPITEVPPQSAQPALSYLGRLGEKYGTKFQETADAQARGEQTLPETVLQATGSVGGAAAELLNEPVKKAVEVTPKPVKEAAGNALISTLGTPFGLNQPAQINIMKQSLSLLAQTEAGKKVLEETAQAFAEIPKSIEKIKQDHPRLARNVGGVLDLANFIFTLVGTESAVKSVTPTSLSKSLASGATKTKEIVQSVTGKGKDISQSLKSGLERLPVNIAEREAQQQAFRALPVESQKAVQAGVELRDVNLVKENAANPVQLERMKAMTEAAKKYGTSRGAEDPALIVGKEFRTRIGALEKIQQESGQALGEAVKDLPDSQIAGVRNRVLDRLKEVPGLSGLETTTKDGKVVLDFKNTSLSGPKSAPDRKAIIEEFNDLAHRDALQLHRKRQELFEYLGGKTKAGVQTTETQDQGLQAIRKGIADGLSEVSPGYKALNADYAEASELMRDTRRFFRNMEDGSQDLLDLRGSLLARRLSSNAQSNPEIRQLLRDMESYLQTKGVKIDTNIEGLQDYYNSLSRYYDITKDTSLAGQVNLGTKDLSVKGLINRGVEAATKDLQVTKATQQRALEELLLGKTLPPVPTSPIIQKPPSIKEQFNDLIDKTKDLPAGLSMKEVRPDIAPLVDKLGEFIRTTPDAAERSSFQKLYSRLINDPSPENIKIVEDLTARFSTEKQVSRTAISQSQEKMSPEYLKKLNAIPVSPSIQKSLGTPEFKAQLENFTSNLEDALPKLHDLVNQRKLTIDDSALANKLHEKLYDFLTKDKTIDLQTYKEYQQMKDVMARNNIDPFKGFVMPPRKSAVLEKPSFTKGEKGRFTGSVPKK